MLRVALITGAGGGLGQALARELADAGYAIAGVDLQLEPLAELERTLQSKGKPVAIMPADVTDAEGFRKATAMLEERFGQIDLLIANAGIGRENPAIGFSAADFEAQIRVNLIGVANSIAAVLPGMLARGHGHLVAISSLASYRGLPLMAGYCASKSGVNSLMDALRVELRPHGICTTTLCPGWVRTAMTSNLRFPVPRMLEADDAARRMVRAIERRLPFYAFPPRMAWQVRLLRWLPTRWSDWLVGRLMRKFLQQ